MSEKLKLSPENAFRITSALVLMLMGCNTLPKQSSHKEISPSDAEVLVDPEIGLIISSWTQLPKAPICPAWHRLDAKRNTQGCYYPCTPEDVPEPPLIIMPGANF